MPFLLEVPVKHLYYKNMAILAINRRDEEKPYIGVNSAGGMGILWKIGKEMVMGVEFPTKVVKNLHVEREHFVMLGGKLSCRKISNRKDH